MAKEQSKAGRLREMREAKAEKKPIPKIPIPRDDPFPDHPAHDKPIVAKVERISVVEVMAQQGHVVPAPTKRASKLQSHPDCEVCQKRREQQADLMRKRRGRA